MSKCDIKLAASGRHPQPGKTDVSNPYAPQFFNAPSPDRARPHGDGGFGANQHRQDPSRDRPHAWSRNGHDRPAAAPAGARGLRPVVERVGADAVALITGEEKILPERPRYCVDRRGDAARHRDAISSPSTRVQLAGDPIAAMSSPNACSPRAATMRPCCWAPRPCAPILEQLLPGPTCDAAAIVGAVLRWLEEDHPRAAAAWWSPFRADEVYAIAELSAVNAAARRWCWAR